MGSEEEEPNLSEDLLTVREEQSGLFTPRLEHIRVGGRVVQVMATASKGNIAHRDRAGHAGVGRDLHPLGGRTRERCI